ncbi:hypothetical protein OEZ74_26500, partial [Leclercia adecarboxylata]|uniref:hypothetical protein n=1 Tax=Leclercia adecarboxylata TaxID=83655 RepID=UPI00234D6901
MTADGSKLLVCSWGNSAIEVVDLNSSPPSVGSIPVPPNAYGPRQPAFVACAANNKALVSYGGGNLSELDLTSLTFRDFSEQVSGAIRLAASPDRT